MIRKLLLIFLMIPSFTFAQEKIEQYCELIAQAKLLSNKVTIDVDFGEERKLFAFKDTRIKNELGKAKNFNSVVAALNYMGTIGWKFVDAFPITEGTGGKVLHFFFKREFDKSELEVITAKD
jgi:hypothetical protein